MQLEHINILPAPFQKAAVAADTEQEMLKKQHTKILNKLKEHQFDIELRTIFSRFFNLEDERKDKAAPTLHMLEYLKALTAELFELFSEKKPTQMNVRLFQILIRFNFNKESVYKFYRNRLEKLLKESDGAEQEILIQWQIESLTPVRSDMAYNIHSNTLAADIQVEVEKQRKYFLQMNSTVQPIQFSIQVGVYVALLRFFKDAGVIKEPASMNGLFYTIREVTRGPDNSQYEFNTIRNRFRLDFDKNVKEAKAVLLKVIDHIDYYEKHGDQKPIF